MNNSTLTAVPGFKVGHWSDPSHATGCTVVLCPPKTTATAIVAGSAPAEYNVARLDPKFGVSRLHAILLTGSSVWGLPAVAGVQDWLFNHLSGREARSLQVSGAAASTLRLPDMPRLSSMGPDSGSAACEDASDRPVDQGNIGAGLGTASGKQFQGTSRATKTGVGSVSIEIKEIDLVVGALVVLNASGSIVDPDTAQIIAGARSESGQLMSMDQIFNELLGRQSLSETGSNTTLAVIATNAKFGKSHHLSEVATMASTGLARAIVPAFTNRDGDIVFALSSGQVEVNEMLGPNLVGHLAAEALTQSVLAAARMAEGAWGLPAARDLQPVPRNSRPFTPGPV